MKHLQFLSSFCGLIALCALALMQPQPIRAGTGGIRADKIEPALLTALKANPQGKFAVVVQSNVPDLKTLASVLSADPTQRNAQLQSALVKLNLTRAKGVMDRLRGNGGQHVNSLALIGGGAATLRAAAIVKLSNDPYIKYIQLDRKLKPLGNPALADLSFYAQEVGAPAVWQQGISGQGIGVAVLDSGIALVDDLAPSQLRIIASVDLVDPANPGGDPGGHGTHVAGIVAGNGADSSGMRMGIAPAANLINVRVIDSQGNAQLSAIIQGIAWVIQHRKQYNIGVMNLSLGASAVSSYRDDPLASAVEMAWYSGIVVVAAAGNDGPAPGTIVTPGQDPFVITVGALDDGGTLDPSDDSVAFFSAQGPTRDGNHKPDLLAPGRKIVSLRVPGSFLDQLLPDRVTDQNYFRLSGTSMAAPVVAGTAALMLQRTPGLRPNQVKSILMSTAHSISGTNQDSAGSGVVDAYAAVNSPPRNGANRGFTPSDAFCQSVLPMLQGIPLNTLWRDPYYKGINWQNITWDNITWDRTTWENITWDNISWDNITWTNITWDNITWDSGTWDSLGNGESESSSWDSLGNLE